MPITGFYFGWYRLRLLPLEPLLLPAGGSGNSFRGALGLALRRIACGADCPGVAAEAQHTCAYGRLFEPAPPPEATVLRNLRAIPRPFVIRPPLDQKSRYEPTEQIELELILVGDATTDLPLFRRAFEEIGAEGIGPVRGRYDVIAVDCLDASGVASNSNRIESLPAMFLDQPPPSRVCLEFLTPTHLVSGEQAVHKMEFHHLVARLRDRINALATFYCGGPLDLDFKGLGERARAVRTVESNLRWESTERRSSRTGQRHEIGGLVGRVAFGGNLAEFLPLLQLGQYVHVGKHAAWGHGRYQIAHG